jgi:hypothetical protein
MELENPARKQPAESGQIRNRDKRETPIRRSVRRELLLREAGAVAIETSGRATKEREGEKGSTWPGCSVMSGECHVMLHVIPSPVRTQGR